MNVEIQERRIAPGGSLNGARWGSSGTITTVAGSDLVTGDRFFLRNRAQGVSISFTFRDEAISLPVPEEGDTSRIILFSSSDTANDVRDKVIRAINRCRYVLIYASISGESEVSLEHSLEGPSTNYSHPSDEVANETFEVSAMSGAKESMPRSVVYDGVRYYDPSDDGMEFVFDSVIPKEVEGVIGGGVLCWRIQQIVADLTDADSHTLVAVNANGNTRELATGSGGYVSHGPFDLNWDERVRLQGDGTVPAAGWWARARITPIEQLPV